MSTKLADDCAAINRRMEEIAAERRANIMGKPIEAPADIDWTLPRTYDSKYLHDGD